MSKALDALAGADLTDRSEAWRTDERSPGVLASETVEERRERLAPRDVGSPGWRRAAWILVITLPLLAGLWFGVLPGSSVVGRYPFWRLQALADRLEASHQAARGSCVGGPWPSSAHVNWLTGRVELDGTTLAVPLTDEERAMIAGPVYVPISHGAPFDRAVGLSC